MKSKKNECIRSCRRFSLLLFIIGMIDYGAYAQETKETEEPPSGATSVKLSQEVMNPTTLAWQLQLEEYAIFKSENQDGFAQNFRIRGILPLKEGLLIKVPQLIRVIAFVNTAPDGTTGLGDVVLNQFFILGKKNWGQFGAGWNIQIPTASDHQLGSPQWSLGPAFTVTFTNLGKWQMYWILENFFTVSENGKYGSSAYAVLQPNVFYTWPNGVYAGIEPEWQIDYKTGKVALPMDFRVGYIWSGKLKYNAYIEPEVMAYRSDGYPRNSSNFGVRLGFRWYLPM
ncbi:hypothetical protein [Flavobacterium sp. IB48]|uniref:hypothetical protein n=1 Tax=Flavobacterium sp. IB48 TaxID=2779375 RepID=UPI0018E6FCF1|nr:hypothetical protein [Flavobacterium sp. IB48]MBJ2123912.1 hypothetical protein [Flavobacterium sp. IB48]